MDTIADAGNDVRSSGDGTEIFPLEDFDEQKIPARMTLVWFVVVAERSGIAGPQCAKVWNLAPQRKRFVRRSERLVPSIGHRTGELCLLVGALRQTSPGQKACRWIWAKQTQYGIAFPPQSRQLRQAAGLVNFVTETGRIIEDNSLPAEQVERNALIDAFDGLWHGAESGGDGVGQARPSRRRRNDRWIIRLDDDVGRFVFGKQLVELDPVAEEIHLVGEQFV